MCVCVKKSNDNGEPTINRFAGIYILLLFSYPVYTVYCCNHLVIFTVIDFVRRMIIFILMLHLIYLFLVLFITVAVIIIFIICLMLKLYFFFFVSIPKLTKAMFSAFVFVFLFRSFF